MFINPDEINSPRKAVEQELERKSFPVSQGPAQSFVDYLYGNGLGDLAAYVSIATYKKCMPLFNAINLRSTFFSQIPIRVWDKKKKVWVEDHDSLELLYRPNADITQTEFLEQVASYYDITGDSFIVATGDQKKKPLELMTVGPQFAMFNTETSPFGFLNVPKSIDITRVDASMVSFKARETPDLGIRFRNDAINAELWHLRSFNPVRSSLNYRGMSRAQPLWLEIQQYLEGNSNNISNLKRGTRLSMAWVNTSGIPLTDDQWSRVQEEAAKYKGSANAGGTPVLDGLDARTIQQTNRDMEFKDLQDSTYARISVAYQVPLALLMVETMTMNNLQNAMLQLFDTSCLPLCNRLYPELTRLILSRYPGSENLEYRYNENDIPALRQRVLENAKIQSQIGVNTIDEIRSTIGDEPLPEGGQFVYKNAAEVPLGSDPNDPNRRPKAGDEVADPENLVTVKSLFDQLETSLGGNREDEKTGH